MKGYEFPSVIAARKQVEKEFEFFRRMMDLNKARVAAMDKEAQDRHEREKAYNFPSVIETRRQVKEDFARARAALGIREVRDE